MTDCVVLDISVADPDPGSGASCAFLPPGSGMEQWSDPGSGIKHPGSATLAVDIRLLSVYIEYATVNQLRVYRYFLTEAVSLDHKHAVFVKSPCM
jgi:hypothetical protein